MSQGPTILLAGACLLTACGPQRSRPQADVASTLSEAVAADGRYISWREHLIDDEEIGGVAIRGGDGSSMGDLDRDGYLDIVSVHESDTEYEDVAIGDLNGDGWPDVVVACELGARAHLLVRSAW